MKYDFATKQSIGIKGNPVTKLCNQLRGFTMDELIESCDDKNYANFLRFIQREEGLRRYGSIVINNIGTILDRVPKYSNYEQIFSAGINEIISSREVFKYTIKDIPKSLIKLCKDKEIKISNRFLESWKENPDFYLLAYQTEYMSLTDDDIYEILSRNLEYWENDKRIYQTYYNKLLNEYGYKAKSLMLYIDELKTLEALDDISFIIREIYDYAKMMNQISPKFDKYPRNFLTTHKIACRNYNRLKEKFEEDIFNTRINRNYEYTYKDYIFIYPNTTQDIKDEAVMQNNCVASYIKDVMDGYCHILFLRHKDNTEKSLVTVEVRNNQIVQAKRKFNANVTEEDQKAIDAWNKKYSAREKEVAA